MNNITIKDIAAIMYMHYLNNYCENDFSFDKGKTRKTIEEHYNNIALSTKDIDEIEKQITINEKEGTDYDVLEFRHPDFPTLFLQVTSLIDYDNHKVNGYHGNERWADVGMFFLDYEDVDFNDLDENE